MAGLDLKGLIGKLNPVCQRALEGAAGLCLSRTNYNVEVEHWLTKLLEQPGNDICLLLKHFGRLPCIALALDHDKEHAASGSLDRVLPGRGRLDRRL